MKANYTLDKILFDWLSYSFQPHYNEVEGKDRVQNDEDVVSDIINGLGMGDCEFINLRGNRGWTNKKYFGGISIHYGGRERVWIEMSGQGCRSFEEYGNGDYYSIFRFVLTTQKARFTRLDIAYDSFNGLIDLEKIGEDIHSGNWISKAGSAYDEWSLKKRHTNKPVEGRCITIGECGSNISMRIYDKGAERNIQDVIEVDSSAGRWIRAEIQLRNDEVTRFVQFLLDNNASTAYGLSLPADCTRLDYLYFGVVNNFFRLINSECDNDTNVWRKPKSAHWAKFTDSVTSIKISLWQKPGTEYNLGNLDCTIEFMFPAPIYAYMQIHGVDQLVRKCQNKYDKGQLAPKYAALINEHCNKRDRIGEYWDLFTNDCRQMV